MASKKLAIAVDIGATNLRIAIIDIKGKIISKRNAKTIRTGKNSAVLVKQFIAEINKIFNTADRGKFAGIGVSIAGPLDYKRGGFNPPNMTYDFVPVINPLEKEFKLPVKLHNDCNVAVLGERYFGSGKKSKNLVYITISSGIGAGIIANGNLVLGKDGSAGEVGHMIVETKYHLPCGCGKGKGHWEAYTSGINIPKFLKVWAKNKNLNFRFLNSAKDILEAAKKRDKNMEKFMEELGKINGAGFSNVILAYNPELIVLSGSVALNNFELIMKYAKKNIDRFLSMPKITKSKLGENAPLLGAAAAVFYEK